MPSTWRAVSRVISVSKATKPSTMHRALWLPRPPVCANSHAAARSSGERTSDWPLPLLDITGLSTTGQPSSSAAAVSSSRVSTNAYGEVARPSSSAASRRMPSRFIVSTVARAVGATRSGHSCAASSSASTPVAIASISGTTTSGRSARSTARSASASCMSTTWLRWAACMAGASA